MLPTSRFNFFHITKAGKGELITAYSASLLTVQRLPLPYPNSKISQEL